MKDGPLDRGALPELMGIVVLLGAVAAGASLAAAGVPEPLLTGGREALRSPVDEVLAAWLDGLPARA